MEPFSKLIPGYPSRNELTRIRHRLAQGESLTTIAATLARSPTTLKKFLELGTPQAGRPRTRTFTATTRNGGSINGLTLEELERLLPLL